MRTITMSKILLAALAILAIVLNISVASAQIPSVDNVDIGALLSSLFANPASLIIFVIQLVLGVGLGYFSAKVFKYVLALIGIFIIGVLLNIWQSSQLESNVKEQLTNLSLTWSKVYPVLLSLIYMLGLTTVLPITLGFVIGLIIAVAK